MENDTILSMSTRSRTHQETVALPAPVLDLIFAGFYLTRLDSSPREPLEWARRLRDDNPQLVTAAAELLNDVEQSKILFGLALDLDYYADEDPGRFLRDLPGLSARFREVQMAGSKAAEGQPLAEEFLAEASEVLSGLWTQIAPFWAASARDVAQQAAKDTMARLAHSDDVMEALPRRHFLQFEGHADEMRDEYSRGRLRIFPLAFADGGGFHINGERLTAVGFGMHGERVHQEMEETVARAAARAKVFSDPTRLMLLNLIIRYESIEMTVGDLARHLGVTQPTVSGHLKLLRDAGLVYTEKKGNRTYPKANEEAIKESDALLHEALRKRS